MEWSETPTIALIPANLGNRLYQFFAARTLLDRVGMGTVSNAPFPEWGLDFPAENPERYRRSLTIRNVADFDLDVLAREIEKDGSLYILNRHHLQKQSLYMPPEVYNRIFPIVSADAKRCRSDQILINIRTGDILSGFAPHYPLTPIEFYMDIVHATGLEPVFMGQLQPCRYIEALRQRFPGAEFIDSRGPLIDFDTIRLARNIIPAVSTFSLAAAWLSDAETIYLPLNGFLNPANMREIDLLPVDDPRYRFFLFPMNYALPEADALAHHARMTGRWKEISRRRVAVLQRDAPFIGNRPAGPAADAVPGFDERYYVHEHPDAAQEISEGWYEDGLHHYLDIGRMLGYAPGPPRGDASYVNMARRGAATQSSRSEWSKGDTPQDDAAGAVNGDPAKDYGFHTAFEHEPWWEVDCGGDFLLKEIRVYNRKGPSPLPERASPLFIEVSRDRRHWLSILQMQPGQIFGSGETAPPLLCRPEDRLVARYVRLGIRNKSTYFHLAEVEVYGIPLENLLPTLP